LLLVSILLLAGCGSKSSSTGAAAAPQTHFAKTKFVIHAGLAFGVFHHFIYEPFKAGDFSHPLRHKLTIVKAIAAALFVRHEVDLARQDARSSKLLSKVVLPLLAIGGAVAVIRAALAAHHAPSASTVSSANSSISSVKSDSSAAGQPIQETTSGAPI
jgi:hypothetical protein